MDYIRVSIYRERSGVWYHNYTLPNGKRYRKSLGTKNEDKARILAHDLERRLNFEPLGLYDPAEQYRAKTWEEAQVEFLAAHCATLRPDTRDTYEHCLARFAKVMKVDRLQDVRTADLEDYASKRKVKPETINRDLRHVRTFLRWAHRREYLRKVPDFSRAFRREDEPNPVVVSRMDIDKVMKAVRKTKLTIVRDPAWWEALITTAYHTGCRRGELFGLRWASVDLSSQTITVRYGTSKGRKDRLLPMLPDLEKALRHWRKKCRGDLVFPWPVSDQTGKIKYEAFHSNWRRILKTAGVEKFVPKNLRSTCGSELIRGGANTLTVRDFLGHSTVVVTERHYAKTALETLRAAAESRKA